MATSVKLSTRDNDVLLDWAQFQTLNHETCYLVALQDWHIALLLSVLRYAEWPKRWRNAPEDFRLVTEEVARLEECLMAGCNVSQLIDVLDLGFAQQHTDMVNLISSLHTDMDALTGQVQAVATAGAGSGDLEDDLANIWAQIEAITTILGGVILEAPIPL